MATNKESINGIIEKLAMISEGLVDILPNAKVAVVYSLNNYDFTFMKTQVNDFSDNDKFKIDISGTEFIFLKDELWNTSVGIQ
jgi:hypothetical protein